MSEKRANTLFDIFLSKRARVEEESHEDGEDGANDLPHVRADQIANRPNNDNNDIQPGPSTGTGETGSVEISDVVEGKVKLDDRLRKQLIDNRAPESTFKFPPKVYKDKRKPSGEMKRYCLHEWFVQYQFLTYCRLTHGVFCIACVLFPMPAHHGAKGNILITQPYRNWKDAREDLCRHSILEYHKDSMAKMKAFVRTMEDSTIRMDHTISKSAAAAIERNRGFLKTVIRAVEYCGRQGIGLRGHRDDGNIFQSEINNLGNFKELLRFTAVNDHGLREYLQSNHRNASYISKTTQNDLLDCIRDYMQQVIIEDIKHQPDGGYFGLSADEVTDCANWEQLGIVLRYVKDNVPVEKLFEYVKCEDIRGETIAQYLLDSITKAGLDPNMCRSQTYDGAGNMAGKQKGASNQFIEKTGNVKALYFHCASHQLNLCLSKASKVPEVYNMVCNMQTLGVFFKFSPKRQRILEEAIEEDAREAVREGDETQKVKNTKTKVKPLCETRWVERHSAFGDLSALYHAVLICLERIETNNDVGNRFDPKAVNEASGIRRQLGSTAFIVAFQTCMYIYGYTESLARQLQGSTIEVAKAYEMVSLVTKQITDIRENVNEEFSNIFEKCKEMAKLAGKTIETPRVASRQTLRSNVEFSTPEEYYRRSVFVPFLDSLVQQLDERFTGKNQDAIKASYLLPTCSEKLDQDVKQAILRYYCDDLPSPSTFHQELKLWSRHWSSEGNQPTTVSDTLKRVASDGLGRMFPNVTRVLSILLCTAATSATVERANSALRYVKTDYRSMMSEDRFNALVLLYIHRDIRLDYNKILDAYANRYPRRMLFLNPLGDE